MPSVVIRPDAAVERYVVWSTVVEAPLAYGRRGEIIRWLRIRDPQGTDSPPDKRLDRADRLGSSAFPQWGFGHWDDAEFIYQQAGWLRRRDLLKAARLLWFGKEWKVLDLLDPLEDDNEMRAHLERRRRKARMR